jgi:sugar (pentulose or hexulose) kinase
MTHNEYERRKARLEEQLRAGIELLESAYRAQVRALDLVWMVQAEEAAEAASAPAQQEPLPPQDLPRRRRAPEVDADVRAAFAGLPLTFTRREVCEALGYQPDRGALYRTLQDLTRTGALRIESLGGGQRGTAYRKTGAAPSPARE